MNLDIFQMQLNESRMGDFYARVKELKALNNTGKEIVKKIAKEFNKSENDVEKLLLPQRLKNIDKMKESELKKIRQDYSQYFSKGELSRLSNKTFIDRLKDRVIAKR